MNSNTEGLQMALAEAYFRAQTIADIAFDYDGYRKPENLMGLIDELRGYAVDLAKFCADQIPNEIMEKFMTDRTSECCSKSNQTRRINNEDGQ